MDIQTGFIDKQKLVANGSFVSYHPIPNGLAKPGFAAYLTNGLLKAESGNILIVVLYHIETDRLLARLSAISDDVEVFSGTKRSRNARVSIITGSSFVNLTDFSKWDNFIFYNVGKKGTFVSNFILNTTASAFGLTDTYYGLNRAPKHRFNPDIKLLGRLKRSERMTQKEILDFFEINLLRKDALWFKSGNFITINVNNKTRLVGHTENIFIQNKWQNSEFKLFEVKRTKVELIDTVNSKQGAYEYLDSLEDRSETIATEILSENAFIPQTESQRKTIKELCEKDISGLLISSSLSNIIIKGLQEKMFRASAAFGKIKSILKMSITTKKKYIEKEEPIIAEKPYIKKETKFNKLEDKIVNEHITLARPKRLVNEDLANKLLELSIELVEQNDKESKRLTLELLKYLRKMD